MELVGRAKWSIEALSALILEKLTKSEGMQSDYTGKVEFPVEILSSGEDRGEHQPRELFGTFSMDVPLSSVEYPEFYDPEDDDCFWEHLKPAALKEAETLESALSNTAALMDRLDTLCGMDPDPCGYGDHLSIGGKDRGGWGLRFGHHEPDGDYCLFFWYRLHAEIQPEDLIGFPLK